MSTSFVNCLLYRTAQCAALMIFCSSVMAGSLLDSYENAKNYDASLKADKAQLLINQETAQQSRAPLLPQVKFNYSWQTEHSNIDSDIQGQTGVAAILNQVSQFTNALGQSSKSHTFNKGMQLTLQQSLFNLKSWHNYKQSLSAAKAAEAEFLLNQSNLIIRVAQAYFNVLKAQAQFDNDVTQSKTFQEQLRTTTLYYDNGLLSITDLYESEAAYDSVNVQLLNSQNQFEIAQANLSSITGESQPKPWGLSEAFTKFPETLYSNNYEKWKGLSLNNNWQIIASQYDIQAAYHNARANSKLRYPTVTGQLRLSNFDNKTTSHDVGSSEIREGNQRAASINIDIPLYNGGFNSAEQRKANAQIELKQHNLTQLKRNLADNIRHNLLNKQTLEKQIIAQKKFIKSAKFSLKTTKFGYENGTRNLNDVLTAQNKLFDARRNYENTRYDYIISALQLKYLSGTLSVDDISTINQWLIPNQSRYKNIPNKPVVKKTNQTQVSDIVSISDTSTVTEIIKQTPIQKAPALKESIPKKRKPASVIIEFDH